MQQGSCQGDIRKVEEAWEASGNGGTTIGNLLFIYLFVTCGILITYRRDNCISRFFVVEHIYNIREDMASVDLMTRLNICVIKWRILAIAIIIELFVS